VEVLRQHGVNSIFFTDANFIGHRRRAKELLLASELLQTGLNGV
jgi:hypothetical protein